MYLSTDHLRSTGKGGGDSRDSRRARMAGTQMDRKETGGLMKEEPGTVLSEQGWPDECKAEGLKREKEACNVVRGVSFMLT